MKYWVAAILASTTGLVGARIAAQGVDASPPPSWSNKAPLPSARSDLIAVAAGGRVYVLGGSEVVPNAMTRWATTYNSSYDPRTDRWSEAAPLPLALSHIGAAELGGRIYVVGGFPYVLHMNAQAAAFVYDPRTNRWDGILPLPTARGSVSVAAANGKIHVFGGREEGKITLYPTPAGIGPIYQSSATVTTHDIYDPKTRRWSVGAPIPGPGRDHAGVAVLGTKIHLFGGRTDTPDDGLRRHDVFDTVTGKWSVAAPLPEPRSEGAYVVVGDKIIYAGGECKPGGKSEAFDDVSIYDAKTDSWSKGPPLPSARHGLGGAVVNGVIYLIGGASACGGTGTVTNFALSGVGKR